MDSERRPGGFLARVLSEATARRGHILFVKVRVVARNKTSGGAKSAQTADSCDAELTDCLC